MPLPHRFRLATFNANSVRSRLPIILGWLAAHQPDVLCLQETKAQDQDFPAAAFREAGYHVVFRGEKSYNGVAIASRQPPDEARYGFDDGGPADDTRLIMVQVAGLAIVNTYVPQGRALSHPQFQMKLEWLARLAAYFDRHFTPEAAVIWAGDLNVAPEPMDVPSPEELAEHVCFAPAARQALATTRAWGFIDVVRQHHPEPGLFTFFDYRVPNAAKRGIGWRIDHILATAPLAARCQDAFVDLAPRLAAKPSDHTFLVADFALSQ
ncbi:MAG: exodeoxyribonuclease III [Thermodesulfobacteriota bacterium]